MPEVILDPYGGVNPMSIWDRCFNGDVGGLEQLGLDGKTRDNYWGAIQEALDSTDIGATLREKKIVELGSGESTLFRAYCVAQQAESYTGVDLFRSPPQTPERMEHTGIRYVREDMLRFLEQLPEENVIIAQFSVLDEKMLDADIRRNSQAVDRIISAITREIYRATEKHGILISVCAGHKFERALEAIGFNKKAFPHFIYDK